MAIKVIPMPIAVAMAGGDKAVYMFRSISDDTPLSDLRDATGFIFFENEELPKAEEEPKEEPEKKPEPKKTVPKRKNAGNTNAKKNIDDGKIRALYEGGWIVSAIADEMKLAPQTVVNHLTKMGIYKTKAERGEVNE